MNFELSPDLAAMAVLLCLLYFLRRRHPQERVDLWIAGLLFIFLEAIAHAFYTPKGPAHLPSHIIALDAYLAAGMVFLWAASKPLFSPASIRRYLLMNTPVFLAVLTTYGLDVRKPGPYYVEIGAALVLGIVSPFLLSRTWSLRYAWLFLAPIAAWVPAWVSASQGQYRNCAYIPLFVLYVGVAVLFCLALPKKSLGRVAIVMGFTVWALVFLLHSWVTDHPKYIDVAARIWDMQKFLVTIGMLLVLLEHQVSSNEWYAFHDHLTGLPNRRLFEDRLTAAVEQSRRNNTRTALVMIDLDGFKVVNDSFGHEAGDRLLQQIAHRLRSVVRPTDTLARLGGDEFILIFSDLPGGQPAQQIVEASVKRISAALREVVDVGGGEQSITGSIGVAVFPDDTADEVLLRRLADERMYEQKRRVLEAARIV